MSRGTTHRANSHKAGKGPRPKQAKSHHRNGDSEESLEELRKTVAEFCRSCERAQELARKFVEQNRVLMTRDKEDHPAVRIRHNH